MSANSIACEALREIVRLERDVVELYRRVAEHELRSDIGARFALLEARHLSAASRTERLLEDVRHREGGGLVADLVAQVAGAFEQMVSSVPVEVIHESHRSTIASLQRLESHLLRGYQTLAASLEDELRPSAERGLHETEVNIRELELIAARP